MAELSGEATEEVPDAAFESLYFFACSLDVLRSSFKKHFHGHRVTSSIETQRDTSSCSSVNLSRIIALSCQSLIFSSKVGAILAIQRYIQSLNDAISAASTDFGSSETSL